MTLPSLNIGMIGLDTSHVTAFAALLNDPGHEFHVAGGTIAAAYPGVASEDMALSYERIDRFTEEIAGRFGVAIETSAEAVAERCDAVMIESVDGRAHLDTFRKIAPYGKPVFIDKPFAVSSEDAEAMFAIAERYGVPLMSCSSLRYADALIDSLAAERQSAAGPIVGADCYGPMPIEPTQPGLFWYGIHAVEMLYRIMGRGCVSVSAVSAADHEVITGKWADGRIGTVRGSRPGNGKFGALIHRMQETSFVDAYAHPRPPYAAMLERIVEMCRTGIPDVPPEETLEIIKFIERANECRLVPNAGERYL